MITWKQPIPEYNWLIHQVWYLEVGEKECIPVSPKLIPNPRTHLLFTPEQQAYCYQSDEQVFHGVGTHLLAASDKLLTLQEQTPLKRFGITLCPQGLYHLVGRSETAINHCGQPDWIDEKFEDFYQSTLWNALPSQQAVIEALKDYLDKCAIKPRTDRAVELVSKAISLLDHCHVQLSVDQLAHRCFVTRRTLERAFKQVTGLSVKQYQMMLTLEQIILTIYQRGNIDDWADLAQEFGFSDQPHLIRYLKKQLAITPSGYMHHRDLTIDIYGDFEDSQKRYNCRKSSIARWAS